MKNRWIIEYPTKYGVKPFRIYADTQADVLKMFPEAVSISTYNNKDYMQYIEIIKQKSVEMKYDYKGREVYKIPQNSKFILVKLFKNGDEYYDIVEFQRWDCCGLMNPITWSMSIPEDFCKDYLYEYTYLPQGYNVTMADIKKMKPVKFYNKCGEIYWRDKDGYFYQAQKSDLPNKHSLMEYEHFKDNPNAVLVRFSTNNSYGSKTIRWFDSLTDFQQFFTEIHKDRPPTYSTPTYEIVKTGYKRKHPANRGVVLRLPFMDVDRELRYGVSAHDISLEWSRLCTGLWCSKTYNLSDFLEKIIKEYITFIQK